MKKILLSSLVAAAAAIPAFAGVNNLNYQAVIKNGSAVVADKQVNLKFELLDSSDKVVFAEEQSPVTNGAGYVACQLGQENDLSELNWGDLKLRVSVDLGSGYQVFSTEAVSSVPTALYALKSADSDMIIDAVQGLMVDVKNNTETIRGINAEVAKFDGFIEDSEARFDNLSENLDNAFAQMDARFGEVDGQLENLNNLGAVVRANETAIEELNNNIEAFAEMNEARLDKMQKQMDEADQGFANLGENLDNSFAQMTAQFAEVDAQLENLNNVAAVVRANESAIEELNTNVEAFAEMNEARLDKMQKQMDEADQSFANLGENLDNSFAQMTAKFEEVDGQLENLNQVAAVVRANESAIEELNTNVEAFAEMNEARLDKMQKQMDEADQSFANLGENLDNLVIQMEAKNAEIDGQLENLNMLGAVVRENEAAIELLTPEVERLVKEAEETQSKLNSFGADIAQIEGLAANVEAIGEQVKGLMDPEGPLSEQFGEIYKEMEGIVAENAATQEKLLSFGADIAQIEGLATDVEQLKEAVYNGILNGEDEDSLSARMAEQIGALYQEIEALKAEIEALKAK